MLSDFLFVALGELPRKYLQHLEGKKKYLDQKVKEKVRKRVYQFQQTVAAYKW